MSNNIKRYLKEVSSKLNCPRSVKSVFIRELKCNILAFTEDKEAISLKELYDEFGTPDEISSSFFDRKDYDALLKKAKKRAAIGIGIGIIASILLVTAVLVIIELISVYGGTTVVTNPYLS